MERIVLAYSGGLEGSVAIPWLAEQYRADVVAVTLDLGQSQPLEDVRERALTMGAVRAHVLDTRGEFARDFIAPALAAGATGGAGDRLATPLGRAIVAKHLVAIAKIEGASLVAHASAAAGADSTRIDKGVAALDASLRTIVPARLWTLSEADLIDRANAMGLPMPAGAGRSWRAWGNLWGRSIEGPIDDSNWPAPPEEVFVRTRPAAEAPDSPAYLEIAWVKGLPVSINGVEMSVVELIQSLETIVGAHGIGRVDVVDHHDERLARVIHEAPAAVVLHAAHEALQALVTPHDLTRIASDLAVRYADLVENGRWFSPAREALDAFVAKVQQAVTGTVRLALFKGACHVVGRRSAVPSGDARSGGSDQPAGVVLNAPY